MKKFLALILSVAMIFALLPAAARKVIPPTPTATPSRPIPSAAPGDIVIATGGTTGTYYAVGNALVTTIGDKLSLSKLTAVDSGASKANVQLVTANQAQMSILQSDVLNYAHNGSGGETMFDGAADKNSLWVAGVYNETVQLVTAPSITSIEDLKGQDRLRRRRRLRYRSERGSGPRGLRHDLRRYQGHVRLLLRRR